MLGDSLVGDKELWLMFSVKPIIYPLMLIFLCLAVVLMNGVSSEQEASGVDAKKAEKPAEQMEIYVLIGDVNMAGRADLPTEVEALLERCMLLNAEGKWVPASSPLNAHSTICKEAAVQKLGPGYSFVKHLLKADPNKKIGLIVNATEGTKIKDWLGKSTFYWGMRKRAKAFRESGQIKGVIWHQGEADSAEPKHYLKDLKTFIATVRGDLGDTNLPFVVGQIANIPAQQINEEMNKLPEQVHFTAVASSTGLTTTGRWNFDTKSQLTLGERYAEQMLDLLKKRSQLPVVKAPQDL